MKKYLSLFVVVIFLLFTAEDCSENKTSDAKDQTAQEKLTLEGQAQAGLPNITNFTQKKTYKLIQEECDKAGMLTYTYTFSEMTGKYHFAFKSVGYPIPYSTQYTSPEKDIFVTTNSSVHFAMPQQDPNGLFMPAAANGTWILRVEKNGSFTPAFCEPNMTVVQHPFDDNIVDGINPKE